MEFTPIVPTDFNNVINSKHLEKAEEISIKSATLKVR